MTCKDFDKICDKEIYHEVEYKESFYDLPESLIEKMTDSEEAQYVKDPQKEEQFQKDLDKEKVEHLLKCNDKGCKEMLERWKNTKGLKEKVEAYS